MGSLRWAWSSGRPRTAVGSLWGWAVSRLHLDRMTRFYPPEEDDEEMLILTHRDQPDQSHDKDDDTSAFDPPGNKPASCNDNRQHRAASGGDGRSPATRGDLTAREGPAPSPTGSTSTRLLALKETRATLVNAGHRTITTTLAASAAGSLQLSSNVGRNPHPHRSRGGRRKPYGATGQLRQKRLSEDGNEKGEDEEAEEGTAPFGASADEEGTGASPSTPPTITAWEAGWNVTNAIQGIFVLGLPFALVQSGYVGLVLLVASAWVCNHTGRILVACLYEEDQSGRSGSKVRVRHSYQDIVEACCKGLWSSWAGLWGWTVNVAQVTELLMTCTLYLVVSTSLLSDSLSGLAVPRSVCSLVSLTFLLPCLLLTDLRPVSALSLLCSLAHVMISLLVMLYCLSRASSWTWSPLSLSVNPEDFLVSVGVIIFSYTSQIFLPPLEGSMEDRGRFNAMLAWTHGAACVMKTTFSLLAVLTWGSETHEVITDNLPSDLRPVVNLCLLAKALLSYPLPFYSAAEILQTCLFGAPDSRRGRAVSRPALLARGAVLITSYLLALLVPRFSLLMGLTGSVTGAAMTLILPCLFHLRLRWGRLAARDQLMDAGILSLGVICSVSGVICSVRRLVAGL